jgi:hypothetical protein
MTGGQGSPRRDSGRLKRIRHAQQILPRGQLLAVTLKEHVLSLYLHLQLGDILNKNK